MQLRPGQYLGGTMWERSVAGVRLTLSAYRPHEVQPWHRHAEPTFFLLLVGEHRDRTRHAAVEQQPFSFVYHPATADHSGETGSGAVRGLNVAYEPAWLERHGLNRADLETYRPLESDAARWSGLRLFATLFAPGPRADADVEMQTLELLAAVTTSFKTTGRVAPRWLRTAEDYLHHHFHESISLRDVATEAGVHPVYLARVFRRLHGCPVSLYLRRLRLTEAGRLVVEGMPLAQAAYAAGFADQAHLSRSFSTSFGYSPKGLFPARQLLQRH